VVSGGEPRRRQGEARVRKAAMGSRAGGLARTGVDVI
jgi:hypothetical protein